MSVLGETGDSITGIPVQNFFNIHENVPEVKKVATSREHSKMAFVVRVKLDAFPQFGQN